MAQKLKLLILLLFLFSNLGIAQATNYTQDANCVSAWTMDVDENPIQDQTANNHDVDLKGAGEPDYTTSGKLSGGYIWDGVDDKASTPGGDGSAYDPATNNFSIIMWVNSTAADGAGNESLAWVDGTGNDQFGINIDDTNNNVFMFFTAGSGSNATATSTTDIRNIGGTHICGMRTATKTAEIYINGVQEGTNTHTGSSTSVDVVSAYGLGFDTATGSSDTNFFTGTQDEHAYFNDALTSTEINDIMDNGLVGAAPPAGYTLQVIIINE